MALVFEHVSYTYTPLTKRQIKEGQEPLWALNDISFEIADGEFLAIAGHTGSGKSTLVLHLNGVINPTHGKVLWDGQDLADKKTANEARGDIGVVFSIPKTSSSQQPSMKTWRLVLAIWVSMQQRSSSA